MKIFTEMALRLGFVEIFRPRALSVLNNERFIRNFRDEGLHSVVLACYASIALLICFIAFPVLSNNYTAAAVWIRLGMLAGLVVVLFAIRAYRDFVLDHYSPVVGGACVLLFISISLILAHPGIAAVGVGFGAMPVVVFGLFLMYGFLRLPVVLMFVIGLSYSAMVCLLSAGEFFGVGGPRMVLYLICFNILGLVLSSSVERRESDLYHQSILLREARDQSYLRAEMAERAYSEKMRLVAAINHDLRQPMSAALSNLELLGRFSFDDKRDAGVGVLNSAISSLGYLNHTLDHVLEAARMESDHEPFKVERVYLCDLIDRVIMAFDADLLKTGMEIRKSYPDGRVEVVSDAGALSRVLLNLIGNGLKFNKISSVRGRGVLVRVKVKGGMCTIDVCDTGIGIAQVNLDCIWEPYKQIDSASRNINCGLGLGLFLVKSSISRLSNHSIEVRSRVGVGSKFKVSLPGRLTFQALEKFGENDPVDPVDWDRLIGAFVVVFGDGAPAQEKEIVDLLHDLEVVCVLIHNIDELDGLIAGSDKALDSVLLCGSPIGLASPSHLYEILARSLPQIEPCVLVEENMFLQNSDWKGLGAGYFIRPLNPRSIAKSVMRGVLENIRVENGA